MKPVNVAVVGGGPIADAHLKAIASLDSARLTWTQDIEEGRAISAAERFGGARCTTSYEEILSSPTAESTGSGDAPPVDAILLCLPHHLHLPFAVAAIEAGKHVLVEKPMALTEGEGREMVEAAAAAGVILSVGHSTRCFPTFQAARSLIEQGTIGAVRNVAVQRLIYVEKLSTDWRRDVAACGGLYLPIFGSHDIDAMLWLLDRSPSRVTAAVRAFAHASGGDSDGYIGLEFDDGAVGSVQFSLCAHTSRQDFVVVGTEGTLVIGRGKLWRDQEEVELDQTDAPFTLQTRLFVEAVQGQRPPLRPGPRSPARAAHPGSGPQGLGDGTGAELLRPPWPQVPAPSSEALRDVGIAKGLLRVPHLPPGRRHTGTAPGGERSSPQGQDVPSEVRLRDRTSPAKFAQGTGRPRQPVAARSR